VNTMLAIAIAGALLALLMLCVAEWRARRRRSRLCGPGLPNERYSELRRAISELTVRSDVRVILLGIVGALEAQAFTQRRIIEDMPKPVIRDKKSGRFKKAN
jgi:hypothetical protein